MLNYLVQLTEGDKRFLLFILVAFLLIFVIVGYLGLLVERIVKYQAKRAGIMLHDVVEAGVIDNPKSFLRFGFKKNNYLFYKQAIPPFLILLAAFLVLIIYFMIKGEWSINLFDHSIGGEGFTTIMFLWDFAAAPRDIFFGMEVISDWAPLMNTPHFEVNAIASYLFVPMFLVGAIWFLFITQGYIARFVKIVMLSKTVFSRTLDNKKAEELNEGNNINTNDM